MTTQNTLNQSIQTSQLAINNFLENSELSSNLETIFGDSVNSELGISLLEAIASGETNLPIEVIPSAEINNARGAFSSDNQTIYLSSELIAQGNIDTITRVLLEETGHYVDANINRNDAPGDEGAIFASYVLGEELDSNQLALLQAEDDSAVVRINGEETAIEQMATIFVNANASGDNDGTSWLDAFTDLQSALALAGNGDQIWIADGTYMPTDTADRSISFVIPSGVELYGGFAGDETTVSQRDIENNVTILSGNIGTEFAGDNSYHVLDISDTAASTILDGFMVSDGRANGSSRVQTYGGGLFGDNANAIIQNLTIRNNNAAFGGGLYLQGGSSVNVINTVFNDNSAGDNGGAIYTSNDDELSVFNSLFFDNQSSGGGAIHTRFVDTLNVINSTFYNNQGGDADSIRTSGSFRDGGTIANNIFTGDSAIERTQIIRGSRSSEFNISNNIVNGIFPLPSSDDDLTGGNNLTEDPLFVDPDNNDFRLQLTSPGIDAGSNDAINLSTDILRNPRIFNGTVDIGAFEYGVLLSVDDVRLEEGDNGEQNAEFTVSLLDTLGQPATEEITVNYATSDGSARAGEDYTSTSGTLTFNIGDTTQTISVPVRGDELIEGNESFAVNLSGTTGNALILNDTAIGTIVNDDQQREISISDALVTETDSGQRPIRFNLTLDRPYIQDITVDYNVVANTATPGEDYIDIDGTVTFEPGETEQSIAVLTTGDTLFEGNETFFVQLSNPSDNAVIIDDRATGTINNNDPEPPPVTINPLDFLNTPITRFQNRDIPGTYLFAGPEESAGIRQNFPNFIEEGRAFSVATEPGEDLIPIYRFQSTQTPGTYLFVDEAERQGINRNFSNNFNEEGLAFYAYEANSGIGTTLYRFQNSGLPGTFLYTGPSERDNVLANFPAFVDEGAVFNVGG